MSTAHGVDAELDRQRVSDHWGKQFEEMRADQYFWTNNPIVTEQVYRLISDTNQHWLPWLFHDYFRDVERFDRVLSVCCGDGAHEIVMYKTGKVGHLRAFDVSEGAVRQAITRFQEAGVSADHYHIDVGDANALEIDGPFDLVVAAGAVHHVTALEDLFKKVQRMIAPSGHFVMLEFVGQTRFQWTDQQIDLINRVLDAVDPKYLRDHRRVQFTRPTVDQMIALDPSEAVRSAEILGLIDRYFRVEYRRDCNGTIMHQLYPLLNARLADGHHEDFDSIIRLVLTLEDAMVRSGALPADFSFLVCQAA